MSTLSKHWIFAWLQDVIDGDLCEQYATLTSELRRKIADDLDRINRWIYCNSGCRTNDFKSRNYRLRAPSHVPFALARLCGACDLKNFRVWPSQSLQELLICSLWLPNIAKARYPPPSQQCSYLFSLKKEGTLLVRIDNQLTKTLWSKSTPLQSKGPS